MPGEDTEKHRPIGLFCLIGNDGIGIQHGDDGSTDGKRPRGGFSHLVGAGKVWKRVGPVCANLLRTLDCLSHGTRLTQLELESRPRKPYASPIPQSLAFDEKNRRTAGLSSRAVRQSLEHLAKRCRLVQRSHRIRQPQGLGHALVSTAQEITEPADFSTRGIRLILPGLYISQRSFDIVTSRIELLARGLEIIPERLDLFLERADLLLSGRILCVPSGVRLLLSVVEFALSFIEFALLAVECSLRVVEFSLRRFEFPLAVVETALQVLDFRGEMIAFRSELIALLCCLCGETFAFLRSFCGVPIALLCCFCSETLMLLRSFCSEPLPLLRSFCGEPVALLRCLCSEPVALLCRVPCC